MISRCARTSPSSVSSLTCVEANTPLLPMPGNGLSTACIRRGSITHSSERERGDLNLRARILPPTRKCSFNSRTCAQRSAPPCAAMISSRNQVFILSSDPCGALVAAALSATMAFFIANNEVRAHVDFIPAHLLPVAHKRLAQPGMLRLKLDDQRDCRIWLLSSASGLLDR